jgi:hypothetical protein
VSIYRTVLLVAAVTTAFIIGIFSVRFLVGRWCEFDVVCLVRFSAILLTYIVLLIRGVEMDLVHEPAV